MKDSVDIENLDQVAGGRTKTFKTKFSFTISYGRTDTKNAIAANAEHTCNKILAGCNFPKETFKNYINWGLRSGKIEISFDNWDSNSNPWKFKKIK